ncbi:T9SS type A sorting domain-containing protein [candidate division KSB1 bacterium]|nr:T9SS type A sorting domain-containing protein [candidate division KSB1 bacterium]
MYNFIKKLAVISAFIFLICIQIGDPAKAEDDVQLRKSGSQNATVSKALLDDRAALVALYNSTNGAGWINNTNWLSANPIDAWYGVTVSGGRVIYLNLSNNNLIGQIPSEIGDLTNLLQLKLYNNQLTGSIPSQIGYLTNLEHLSISNNQLSGPIPPQIGGCTSLNYINLLGNQLNGQIPPEIGNLMYLETFYANTNQFSGPLPVQIGNLTSLSRLYVYRNEFTELPDLSHLSSLEYLFAYENRFTFEDIEPNIGIPDFRYSNQAKVGYIENIIRPPGSSVTFSVSVGGTANQYQWYKDNVLITGATNDDYTINPIDYSDAGAYTCKITNTIATALTLETNPKNLTVAEGPTSISVTYPNGGETWQVGSAYDVTWSCDNYIGDVKIEISTNGGNSWWDLTQGGNTQNDGKFSYMPVIENISNHCLIKVVSAVDPNINDQSDHEFSIMGSSTDPFLGVAPTSLDFGTSHGSLSFLIANLGGGTLIWQVAENPEQSWITGLTPDQGTDEGTVTVNISRGGLSPGIYSGKISVTSNGGNRDVSIRMIVPTSGYFILDGDSTDWMGEPLCSSAPDNLPNYFPAEVHAAISDIVDIKHLRAKIIDDSLYFFIRLWGGPVWPNFCQASDGRIYNRGYYTLLVDLDNNPNTGWHTHWYEGHLTSLGYYNSMGVPDTDPIGAEAYFELGLRTDYYPPHSDGHVVQLRYFAADVHEIDSQADVGIKYDIFELEPANPDTFDLYMFEGNGYDQVANDGSFSWCGHAWGVDFLECGIGLPKFIAYWNKKGESYLNSGDIIGVAAFVETPIDDWGTDFSPRCEITVGASQPPVLAVDPKSLNFGTTANSLNFEIDNSGGGNLIWNIFNIFYKPWITSIVPGSGSGPATVTITVDRNQLSSDSDTASLLVASNGGSHAISVLIAKSGKPETITLNLNQGWNMFSINVNPANPNIEILLNPIVDNLKLVKNGKGQNYIPAYSINQIGDINYKEGYQAYLTSAASVDVTGDAIAPNTPIELPAGWSMISYLPDVPIDAVTALASVGSKLKIAKDNGGNAYIPVYGINQIGNMQPGQGYQIYLTEAGTLIYPSGALSSGRSDLTVSGDTPQSQPKHFSFSPRTGQSATLVIPQSIHPAYSDGSSLDPGDEIAVYSANGFCCGAVMWQGTNAALTLWGDNDRTKLTDGLTDGETFRLLVWRESVEKEYPVRFTSETSASAIYRKDGFFVLTECVAQTSLTAVDAASHSIPTEFRLLQNYPNPFNPATVIRYELPEAINVTIEIYNHLGQRIRTLVQREQPAGIHQCAWDGRNESGKTVPSGVYFYRLQSKVFSATKKMLFMH